MTWLTPRAAAALLSFSIGVAAWDLHRTFTVHGLAPVRRVLRIKTAPAPSAALKPPARQADIIRDGRQPDKSAPSPGVVSVSFRTDVGGRVTDVEVLGGDPAYFGKAVGAASRLKFPRRRYRGYRVGTMGHIVYKFVGERRLILEKEEMPAVGVFCPN